jgi:PhzF family phenazine biosynthesis protein
MIYLCFVYKKIIMKFTLYQVDAFTNKVFGGNPAAVIPLDEWIPVELMQNLAMENNLSETVFFAPASLTGHDKEGADFEIRWFTPDVEINLCGHATLASAHVLYNFLNFKNPRLVFHSKSGKLEIEKRADLYVMNFPAWKPERIYDYPDNLEQILGVNEIVGVYKHRNLLVELNKQEDVQHAKPDFTALKKSGEKVIITAPGIEGIDFVSRFFAPSVGIDEDPVTGSAHSQLIPFWSEKLNKKKMHAKQLSQRGGELWVGHWGDRVSIAGQCVFYMKGEIEIEV